MRKSITVLIALAFIFGLATVSFAAEKAAAPAAKQAPAKEAAKKAIGMIGTIDMKKGTLTVKEKKAEITVAVDSQTKITAGQSKKSLADLKSGEKVRVTYEIVNGKNIAKMIDVQTVVATQPSAPSEKKAEGKSTTPAKATR